MSAPQDWVDAPGRIAGRPMDEWNSAYVKVESYFHALNIRNRVLLGQMVLRVLEGSESPLHVREVHALVEERLRKPVSRDTVRSCLTEGVRLERFGLKRVSYGTYRLDNPEIRA